MKQIVWHYKTTVNFSVPVREHSFLLRFLPSGNVMQRIVSATGRVSPEIKLSADCDTFGNAISGGYIADPHSQFVYESFGILEIVAPYELPEPFNPLYLYPSPYVEFGDALDYFLDDGDAPSRGTVDDKVFALSEQIFRTLQYAPRSTDVATTALEALTAEKGVCQDYAHVLIALCRKLKIAARYVVGFMPGEKSTHAWVEYFSPPAKVWRAIDPTHCRQISAELGYLKLSHGRDFGDCAIERGVFVGITSQKLTVELNVSAN